MLGLVLAISFTTGCDKEEVYEDQRMKNSSERVLKEEFNAYNTNLIASGYNFYSNYIGDLVESLDEDSKVDPEMVRECMRKVDIKREEIKNIDNKKVKEAMDIIAEDLSKNDDEDKNFDKQLKLNKDKVAQNKKNMLYILDKIDKGLSLGLDGDFSKEDKKQLSLLESNIISVYNRKI